MSIFDWFKTKEETTNPTKQSPRRPKPLDITEQPQVNKTLTYGLYHNSYPGMKLAGAMAFTPIAVPLWFMGIPTPTAGDDAVDKELAEISEMMARHMKQIHLQCHREGTIWIMPKIDARTRALVWEFISDDAVVDIIKDLNTGEPVQIITDEEITLSIGEEKQVTVRRKRYYSRERIDVRWVSGAGQVPGVLRDQSMRNPLGILPIPFSNNSDGDEIRGHSDYERIISDLKNYHDIDLKQSTFLAKFEPKLGLHVTNVDDWLVNNGEEKGSLSTLDVFERDILFFVKDETGEYLFPENAMEAYDKKLQQIFRKLVEGSGMPEIIWGTKVEGNHASAQENMNNLVKFVEDKREQKADSYKALFSASLRLLRLATMTADSLPAIKIKWNNLDSLSDETKAKIFRDFAQGLAFVQSAASGTKEMMWNMWKRMFPGVAPEKLNEFILGISDMAKHKQFAATDYAIIADMTGLDTEGQQQEPGAAGDEG